MLNTIKKSAVLLCLFVATMTSAQNKNGWELILQNDFYQASAIFRATLEKDSTHQSSLEGMIFLSETSGDELALKKYVNRYMRHYGNDNFFLLFRDQLDITESAILKSTKLSDRVKIGTKFSQADREFYDRKFESSYQARKEITGNLEWHLIGPFSNIEGSGHITAYGPEKDRYDSTIAYYNDKNVKLKWIKPAKMKPGDGIDFSEHLISSDLWTNYASSFFENTTTQEIQIRISRMNPIKLWLDGQCIYDADFSANGEWDNEIIQFRLEKGKHALLLKCSTLPEWNNRSITNFSNYEDYFSDLSDVAAGDTRMHHGDVLLRITDKQGKILENIQPVAAGKPETKSIVTQIERFFTIGYYESELNHASNNYFTQYLLGKAYAKYQFTKQKEKLFVDLWRKNKNSVFFQFLLYNMYLTNGKNEKAYEILSGVDFGKTPVFDILYGKIQEVDENNDEEHYLRLLDSLEIISPSNRKVIRKFIRHYEKKGMEEEKEKYVKNKILSFPEYEDELKIYLKKDAEQKKKEDREDVKNAEKKSYKKNIRKYKREIKKHMDSEYYDLLIEHYTLKHNIREVIRLYDELISIEPWNTTHYYNKAKFYFDEENYTACLQLLDEAKKINPGDENLFILSGDALFELNEKNKALENYKYAKQITTYDFSINEKIEKITGPRQLKKLFKTKTLNDILSENTWEKSYATEESVVLIYTKDLVLTNERELEIFQHFAVKILSDAGIKKWLEYDFGFLGTINSARIIKSNGAEVIPEEENGYIVSKNLEVGDIIYLEGVWSGPAGNGDFTRDFYGYSYFSFEGPIHYCKYEIAIPEGNYIGIRHHKLPDNAARSTHDGFDFYKYEYEHLPKLIFEDAMIDKMDNWANVMVSTMPDWGKMVDWYTKKTYKKLESGYEIEEVLDSIIKPGMSDSSKIEAIYNYLTSTIKYSYVPFLQSNYIPKDPGQTLSSRIGDCKDVSTLMISMLRKVGIDAYYVLVKTNDYFYQDILPSNFFNHAIAGYYLNGKLHFADMTTDYYPYYILPAMDAGACALLIKEGNAALIRLPKDNLNNAVHNIQIQISADLSEDRSAMLHVQAKLSGLPGGDLRERITQIGEEEKRNTILQLMGNGIFSNLSISSYQFSNTEKLSEPLKGNFIFGANNFCDRVSGLLVFRIPYMYAISSHPAIYSKTRFNQLDVKNIVEPEGSWQQITIKFPAEYDLIEMPKDFSLHSKYGDYSVQFKKINNGLLVEKKQVFHLNIIASEEFDAFKSFYLSILDIDSSKFALIKKGKKISDKN